ncbi:glycoside hydrolase family 6 protein [Streptomyces sp. NBC_00340]|uniref:glycoside hydrolase family 6 protein n=1 Tax=Streptomyces sp. NBC_00340 TaxID=2975716 RepID=UPI00225148C9|nr:glycoside hydrolase family 6 protein [Streptomyces sp. NBC_00340]MCX5133827.1 glycoside hydrolase family 6 protein [Streptomyces sp. NBC_00340]
MPLVRALVAAAVLATVCGTGAACATVCGTGHRTAGQTGTGDGTGHAAAGPTRPEAAGPTRHDAAGPTGRGGAPDDEPFFVAPGSHAARQATTWRAAGRTADAHLMDRIAARPQAEWLTGPHPEAAVRDRTTAAARHRRTAVLVAYYIPQRDCGAHSAGGAPSAAAYRAWIDAFAAGLGDRDAYVVVEPDAVPHTVAGCAQVVAAERYALLAYAVDRLGRQSGTRVYLDAGNPGWIPDPARLVGPLRSSGVTRADGVALNVSNFHTDRTTSSYGKRLSGLLGGTRLVIDTSRNGNGPHLGPGTDLWCNPPGRALGRPPTRRTGDPLIDAYLWIKRPGESDGTCRGGPAAGRWWPSYALDLAANAHD